MHNIALRSFDKAKRHYWQSCADEVLADTSARTLVQAMLGHAERVCRHLLAPDNSAQLRAYMAAVRASDYEGVEAVVLLAAAAVSPKAGEFFGAEDVGWDRMEFFKHDWPDVPLA